MRRLRGRPRLAALAFGGPPDAIWAGIARHGRPIQYAHVERPLALWDVWTRVASMPVAFEPPSAGFVLDWRLLATLRERCVGFATLTHAAGISSTGRMSAALERHGYRSHEFGDSVLVVRRPARRPRSPSRRPATARRRS